MFILKILVTSALISIISATFALAQEPAAFQAQYPDRDVLNGGALTPAGRLGLEQPYGAAGGYAANNAYAGVGGAGGPSADPRYRSYAAEPGSFRRYGGRRRPYR
jgi:hypothetical protein